MNQMDETENSRSKRLIYLDVETLEQLERLRVHSIVNAVHSEGSCFLHRFFAVHVLAVLCFSFEIKAIRRRRILKYVVVFITRNRKETRFEVYVYVYKNVVDQLEFN